MANISITPANFIPSANATVIQGIAGGTLTRGMPVYLDTAAGTYKALVLTSTTTDTLAGLVCGGDVAANQPMLIVTKDPALAIGGTCASGDTIWCSNTGITLTQADLVATWRIIFLGVGTASGVINFDPCRGGVK
jgi:hypothetical protein